MHEFLTYFCGDTRHKGYLTYDEGSTLLRPGVILAPTWSGIGGFICQKAEEIASLGYVALVADLYGEGHYADTNEESARLMRPLFLDRSILQERIQAAYQALKLQPMVDPRKVGAMGFCFGGLAVIELLRSGVDIRGVVTFHAVLGNHLDNEPAQTVPITSQIRGNLLMLHGYLDPKVSAEDLTNIQQEMTEAGVDWQLNTYGEAMHAFSDPMADDPNAGKMFHPKVNLRAIQSMELFFEEVFN